MATLRDIRRRIQSVENVEQITQAMERVAVARLHRAQVKSEQSHRYAAKLQQIVERISSSFIDYKHPFLIPRKVSKTGVIIVAGEKGLCGSYNALVFKEADRLLKEHAPDSVELFLVGQKAIEYYRQKKLKIRHSLKEGAGKISFQKAKEFSHEISDSFLKGELDEILLVYTHFISIGSREVVRDKFLPVASPSSKEKSIDHIFEPNAKEVYNALLPRYCQSKVLTMFDEANASELAARAFSMHKAAKNARDMVDKLTLLCNKVRQSGITREIIEIANGAEGTN